ncbi:MAG TPA: polysaccharide biosynthesis tyrosine autokinase [Terriglobales bacterium]|nr:polysaccharide biosynthesis tyrosine autokinase [Terriglobales bacterium]
MNSQALVKCEEQSSRLAQVPPAGLFARIPQQTPLQQSLWLVQKYRWTIAAFVFGSVLVAALVAALQPRAYRATANLAIYRDSESGVSLSKTLGLGSGDLDDYSVSLDTQLHILQSRTLALFVVRKLGLDKNAGFMREAKLIPATPPSESSELGETAVESAAADVLLFHLAANTVKQTRIVEVSYTGPDAQLNAQIVNTLVDGFIDDSIRSRYEASTRSARFLSSQLTDLRTKVEESQQKLVAYEREHNIVGTDDKQNVITAKLEDLNRQLTAAEAERMEKESIYQTVASGDLDQLPEMKSTENLQALRLREADLKNEYAQATTTYGPNYPKVIELNNRIKSADASIQAELKRVQARAKGEYLAAARAEQKLKTAFEQQKQEANRLNESAIQYGLLKRDFDSNRQLYDSLQERMKEAGVAAGLRSSNIRVIDAAEVPRRPVSPNLGKASVIGLFLGFVLSAIVIALQEGMHRALDDPADVEAFTAMPSLALIPEYQPESLQILEPESPTRNNLISLTKPNSAEAEAYRALGTSILFSPPELKTLVVTSSLPGEGKTSVAANCAVIIAQQGKRVLLVDADLRKPTLHTCFGLSNARGLTSILRGVHATDEIACPVSTLPQLAILTAGPEEAMPAEMLGSSPMHALMRAWREHYDYVIIDTAPILAVTDALRIAPEADSMLLVMRSGQTTREALARACSSLNRHAVPVLGIVVNAVNFRSSKPYYGYHEQLEKTYYRQT